MFCLHQRLSLTDLVNSTSSVTETRDSFSPTAVILGTTPNFRHISLATTREKNVTNLQNFQIAVK